MYRSTQESRHTIRVRLGIIIVSFLILLVWGMFGFHFLEGWSYKDALYFSAISLMTRGQSNLFPTTFGSVLFTIFYLFIGVAFIIYTITTLLGYYISYYQEHIERRAMRLINTLTRKKKVDKKPDKWIVLKRPEKK